MNREGKNLLRGGGWSCLWLLWHPWECSTQIPSSSLGIEISGIYLAEKVGEPRSVSSILNNISGLQCDAVHLIFLSHQGLRQGRRKVRGCRTLHMLQDSRRSLAPGAVMAETSLHYQQSYVWKYHVWRKFWTHIIIQRSWWSLLTRTDHRGTVQTGY